MEMLDSVFVPCSRCGGNIEFQSKVGDCVFGVYTIDSAPTSIMEDLVDTVESCNSCDHYVRIVKSSSPYRLEE